MSRKIIQLQVESTIKELNKTHKGKIVITKWLEKEIAVLIRDNRLLAIRILDAESKVDAIYIGKVKKLVKNLDACFVEIADKEICYLPFSEVISPLLINRTYDSRILEGDEILVQVKRDALKTKQASLTTNVSFQTPYFVYTLGNSQLGISGKLSNADKTALKNYLLEYKKTDGKKFLHEDTGLPSYGCIVRTQAAKLFTQSKEDFMNEFIRSEEKFIQFLKLGKHHTCFSCIRKPNLPYRAIIDEFSTLGYEEVVTDLNSAYTSLEGMIEYNVRFYHDTEYPLSKLYSLETKIKQAMDKLVWLPCGGNIVIEQTECLTTIDVNSGKMTKGNQTAEAIWQINVEAAKEAALQIRLRNISGIIIIDFINMQEDADKKNLLKLMKDLTGNDPVTTSVIDITPLGLMEITRKKIHKSLAEQFM